MLPDLSPIVNVWSVVAERLAHHHTPVITVDKLWYRVEAAWSSVPVHAIQSLFRSMPRCISAVFTARASRELCYFEQWSNDELHMSYHSSPLLTTTPQQENVSAIDRFNWHLSPTRWVFSGTELELVPCQPRSDTLTTRLAWPLICLGNELEGNFVCGKSSST
ncbi:hypothetical protein TNCV_4109311 [Trichonephila clavipes]|nr:hypothetical protein TNCV_4109311 [Trichonephila clavipes]